MLAAAALVLFAPLITFVAFIVYVKVGSPILIKEARIDHRGDTTEVLVFRTGPLALLRRTGLDKLPGVINVMRGDCGFETLWY
jgi:lipopolysaccharide/colanic/teichoic acid biosynthesis glycosyltransferase